MEEGKATQSSIHAWRIPWTEEPGGLTVHGVSKSLTRLKQLSTNTRKADTMGRAEQKEGTESAKHRGEI